MRVGGQPIRIAVAFLGGTVVLAAGARAAESTIHLKDGSAIKGVIASESKSSVVVKLRFGSITYARSDIKSIERGRDSSGGAAAGAAGWRDVIILKDGDEHRGLIVSEDDDAVTFDLVMSGASVTKTLTMRTRIACEKIKEVRRLTGDQRSAARSHLENVKRQEERDARGEQDIRVEQTFWDSKDKKKRIPARMVELEHFVIEANTDEDFLRKAAHRLGKVFDAYKRHFGVDRNAAKKVRVVIFNSMGQYYASIDNAVKNPAFYAPDLKLVAAGCDIAAYRAAVDEARKRLGDLRKLLETEQARIDKARAKVRAIVDGYHRQIHTAGSTTPRGKAIMNLVRREERKWQIQVMKYEKPLKDIKRKIGEVNRRNERIFDERARHMLRTLYHEGFHAFLDQFLLEEELVKKVPRWLNEGLAQYFEEARVEGSRLILGQENRPKIAFLRKACREGKLVPMPKMLTAGAEDYLVRDTSDIENSTKHYLQAWCLIHLASEKGRVTKEALERFVRAVAGGAEPMTALPGLTGMTNAELKELWAARLGSSIRTGE
jgi:hypothetical protein